jgi:NADH-quinone oxidoreductase subunit A
MNAETLKLILDESRGNFWSNFVKPFTILVVTMDLHPLTPLLLIAGIAVVTAVGMLVMPHLFGPRRSTPVKDMPYESGMDPIGDSRARYDVRFYLVAIIFLVFDVELLFLYPWAVAAGDEAGLANVPAQGGWSMSTFVFVEILIFMTLLGLAYVYAWRKGVFNWR